MKKLLLTLYNVLGFTGLWFAPIVYMILSQGFPGVETRTRLLICLAVMAWTSFNNFWSVACEGKRFDEIGIGDGLIPDTGLRKESPQKRESPKKTDTSPAQAFPAPCGKSKSG